MWTCFYLLFPAWYDFFGLLYRRDRALEVAAEVVEAPEDGSNGHAVVDEAAL